MRSCVGCGERAPQDSLLRIALVDGDVRPDRARRVAGRGAYLHERPECWTQFVGRRGPVRSLRAPVPRPARERLVAQLAEGVA